MNILNNIKSKSINIIIGSLILPSLLLPIKYSSLMLIIISIATLYNLIYRFEKKTALKSLMLPFCIYYLSIILCFIVDLSYNQFSTSYLARNLSLFIIPLFIFSSNFSKKQILKLLNSTAFLITFTGVIFLIIWLFGYNNYNNKQEFLKKDWFKNEVRITKNYSKNSSIEVVINSSAQKPSLRKVLMLKKNELGSYLERQLVIKSENTNQNTWVLLRNVDGDCRAWFNVVDGEIGFVEGKSQVKSEKQSNGYYKFTFVNPIKSNATRDWFYISFVSNNGSYRWTDTLQNEVCLKIKSPKLFIENGKNLLQKQSILNYSITSFSSLENYAHNTYFGLVFSFALIIFIFTTTINKIVRFTLIFIVLFIIIALESKAIIISICLILPVYYLSNYLNFKFILIFLTVGVIISFNSHLKERFLDMFQTIESIGTGKEMGDLKTLSTNNRFYIYKTYLQLIAEKPLYGYGYKNGEDVIQSKLNYKFNAHNQFFQSFYHSGVLGFVIFLFFSLSPILLKRKFSKKKYGLELIVILIIFNLLFESLLYRQWGLIFVCFIYAMYFQFFKSDLRWFR